MSTVYDKITALGFADKWENIFWAYDDKPFSIRSSPDQVYIEKPGHGRNFQAGNLKEECLRAARLISQKHPKPVILLSGGIDSEMCLLSFHLQSIPVEIVIVDLKGLNDHDTFWAKRICDNLGLNYKIKTFDPFSFWEFDLESFANKVSCTSPQVGILAQVLLEIDGYPIIADGDTSLKGRGPRFFESKGENWALARWLLLHERPACPRFFQYTPELETSWYFEPLVEEFISGTWHFFDFQNFIYLKPFIAHEHFGCHLRPKYNGYENIPQCAEYRKILTEKMSFLTELHWTYEDARTWATQTKPDMELLSLRNSHLSEIEKNLIESSAPKKHMIWKAIANSP